MNMPTSNVPTAEQVRTYASDPLAFLSGLRLPVPQKPRLGDCIADFQREAFEALAPTLLAVAVGRVPPVDRYWIERTKGASKDGDIAACLLWLLAFSPRPLEMRAGASDFDQVNELRKSLRGLVRANEWLSARIKIQTTKILNEATGSALDFLTSDATGSHGSRPDVTVVNEMSHGVDEEFASTLCDDADKVAGSVVILATNAGFVGTWQHKWREANRLQAETDESVFFQKVSEPALWISPKKLAAAKSRNSNSRYRRLWRGIWSVGGGDAIDEADIERATQLPGPIHQCEPGWLYAAGLDLGIRRDRCGFVVVRVMLGGGVVQVCDARSWEPPEGGTIDLRHVRQVIGESHRLYRFVRVAYDPYQAVLLSQDLMADGVPMAEVTFNGQNLDIMARAILAAFRDSHIELYDDPQLLADLRALNISERRGFGYKLTAPSNASGHADLGTALACILPSAIKAATSLVARPANCPIERAVRHAVREIADISRP